MAYTIRYSNGKILTTLADQSYDDLTTSLTLVGKNSSAYGESINQNFVRLLENFANTTEPRSPVTGQLWFNTALGRMYVYTTSTFRPVGGTIISAKQPNGLTPGDLWIDTTSKQLWWFDGTSITSSGKNYSDVVGKSGWITETVIDESLSNQTISSLYNNGELLAVLSEKDISLNNEYCGTDFLNAGLTLNSAVKNIKFNGTATYALGIQGFSPTDFLLNYTDSSTTGTLKLLNDLSATFGPDDNLQIYLNQQTPVILGAIPNRKLDLRVVNSDDGEVSLVTLDGLTKNVGINNPNPLYPLDIVGNVKITGNLVVSGAQTTLETSVIQVKDINIELGTGQTSPSDSFVNGGGIILKGSNDHTILYNQSRSAWSFSENIDLASSKGLYVDGTLVIDNSSVYSSSAPGLIDLGRRPLPNGGFGPYMNSIVFDGISLTTNTIKTSASKDLVISPGSGIINFTGTQIVHLGQPTIPSNAATKGYVDGEFSNRGVTYRRPHLLTIDVTDFLNVNEEIINYLNKLLPIDGGILGSDYSQPIGSVCSVLAETYLPRLSPTAALTLNKERTVVYTTASTTASVITDVAGTVAIAVPTLQKNYQVKMFQVSVDNEWIFLGDIN